MEHSEGEEDELMQLLGLSDDPEDQTTRNFMDHCINVDGLGHTLHMEEIIDEIEIETNEEYIYFQVISDIYRPDLFSLDYPN
jgi:hypothetical protein